MHGAAQIPCQKREYALEEQHIDHTHCNTVKKEERDNRHYRECVGKTMLYGMKKIHLIFKIHNKDHAFLADGGGK
jgi:hypothetical protein